MTLLNGELLHERASAMENKLENTEKVIARLSSIIVKFVKICTLSILTFLIL